MSTAFSWIWKWQWPKLGRFQNRKQLASPPRTSFPIPIRQQHNHLRFKSVILVLSRSSELSYFESELRLFGFLRAWSWTARSPAPAPGSVFAPHFRQSLLYFEGFPSQYNIYLTSDIYFIVLHCLRVKLIGRLRVDLDSLRLRSCLPQIWIPLHIFCKSWTALQLWAGPRM